MKEALTFDDVLLVPQLSSILPKDVDVLWEKVKQTKRIKQSKVPKWTKSTL